MSSSPRLIIELVPQTAWFKNIRSMVSASSWDKIRKAVYEAAGHRCEICQGVGTRHPVECHEIWHYDDTNHIQTLTGLIALCPSCHEVKHIGLAQVKGNLPRAKAHLMMVNSWTPSDAQLHIQGAFKKWVERSQYPWILDTSYLDKVK